MKKAFFILICSAILLPTLCCGQSVTGTVSIRGNEPFTYVVITDENNVQYKVTGEKTKIIAEKYQGKTVKATGTVTAPKKGEFGTAEITVTSIDE